MQIQAPSNSQITVLRRLAPQQPQTAPLRQETPATAQLVPQDSLLLQTRQLGQTQPIPAQTLKLTALAPPDTLLKPIPTYPTPQEPNVKPIGQRTWEDYQKMLAWVERVTGKPTAYQTPESQHAYIKSIKGKPQDYYDTTGFLKSIGVTGVEAYGRDDQGVHSLLKTIKYSPNSEEVSWPLRMAQKAFYWVYLKFPKTFDKLGSWVDKVYFTKKDMKAQSWLNVQVPQPGISPNEPLVDRSKILERYKGTQTALAITNGQRPTTQEIFDYHYFTHRGDVSIHFEADFHMGVPQPGESEQHYGSFAIAKRLGFTDEQAARIGTANYDTDLNTTVYGKSDAFPDGLPSRHFNLNKDNPGKGDTRFIWAQRHLDAAVELAKRGRFEQAEQELGFGLHGIQDAFAHGHIKLASHAITDNIPDGVDYNPIGAYEATLASVGYMNEYIKRVLAP